MPLDFIRRLFGPPRAGALTGGRPVYDVTPLPGADRAISVEIELIPGQEVRGADLGFGGFTFTVDGTRVVIMDGGAVVFDGSGPGAWTQSQNGFTVRRDGNLVYITRDPDADNQYRPGEPADTKTPGGVDLPEPQETSAPGGDDAEEGASHDDGYPRDEGAREDRSPDSPDVPSRFEHILDVLRHETPAALLGRLHLGGVRPGQVDPADEAPAAVEGGMARRPGSVVVDPVEPAAGSHPTGTPTRPISGSRPGGIDPEAAGPLPDVAELAGRFGLGDGPEAPPDSGGPAKPDRRG